MTRKLEKALEKTYQEFFGDMGIDPETGRHRGRPNRKFATYPYVGSKYKRAKKILFVGLYIAKDASPGCIQSFPERRASIEYRFLSCHNPHIAGTYMTALYFLKEELGWDSHWEKIADADSTCQKALKGLRDLLPSENPLSYCALTNWQKFAGEKKMEIRDREEKLFDEELRVFKPDVVVFQGACAEFKRKAEDLKKAGTRYSIHMGQSPTAWAGGVRRPKILIDDILQKSRHLGN